MSSYKKEDLIILKENILKLNDIISNIDINTNDKKNIIRQIKEKLIQRIKTINPNIDDDEIKKEILNYFKLNSYIINKEIKKQLQQPQQLQQQLQQKLQVQQQPQQLQQPQQKLQVQQNKNGFSDFFMEFGVKIIGGLIFTIPFMLIFKKDPKTGANIKC
jgi:hypothetical protein